MLSAILSLSMFAAVMPCVTYLVAVRWLGRLEREPLRLILLVVAWGAIGGTFGGLITASAIEDAMAFFQPRLLLDMISYALYVPAAEEISKGIVLVALAATPRIGHMTSGLVYGLAVGLGFAITENMIYAIHVFQNSGLEGWYVNLVIRTLFTSTVHGICSAMFGFCLGWAKVRVPGQPRPLLGLLTGLSMAFSLHGLWNAVMFVGIETDNPMFSIVAFVSTPFLVLILLIVTHLSLRDEGQIIADELLAEAASGLIPAHHIPILASPLARRRRDWLDPGVDEARYAALADQLALRRRAGDDQPDALRALIRATLER